MKKPQKTIDFTERLIKDFVEKFRPEEHLRDQLDVGYSFDGRELIIHEIRPRWDNPSQTTLTSVAKAVFVKSKGLWKVYWMRADLKWHAYPPMPAVKSIAEFFELLWEDSHACFWG